MANTRQIWLKSFGTGADPFPNNWLEERPDILSEARFPRRPSGIKTGDLLVYYAAHGKKLFALARSTANGADAPDEPTADTKRWPYSLRVQTLLAVPSFNFAPDYAVLGKPTTAMRQQSHIELTDAEYKGFAVALHDGMTKAMLKKVPTPLP